jgi:hypothetical protein
MRDMRHLRWFGAMLVVAGSLGLLAAGCQPARPESKAPAARARGYRLELDASLEPERARYRQDIDQALDQVIGWFGQQGMVRQRGELIDRAIVFRDEAAARPHLARHFGVAEDMIPPGFSGTVGGKTLFLVSRAAYADTFARLFPEHAWSEHAYRALVTHELAHRAHEVTAIELTGAAEGMGPRWFFEGLAIACTAQFEESFQGALPWAEIQERIARDAQAGLSYPLYGQMFRSLATRFAVKELVRQAGRSDFVSVLEARYTSDSASK